MAKRHETPTALSAIKWTVLPAIALLLFMRLFSTPASALIEAKMSLKEVIEKSKVIVEGEIDVVDLKERKVTAKITDTLKGTCTFKQIKFNVAVGQEWYPEAFMTVVKKGQKVIFFWDIEGDRLPCLGYTDALFFQLYGDKNPDAWWTFTHIEARMNRCYNGTTEELLELLQDIMAGKAEPPPAVEIPRLDRAHFFNNMPRPSSEPPVQPEEVDGYEAFPKWAVETWGNPAEAKLVTTTDEKEPAAVLKPGLFGEYFHLATDIGDFPNVAGVKPTVKRADLRVDFPGTDGAFAGVDFPDQFYIRWTGFLRIPKDGKYRLFATSDDGSRMFVDGKQVIDNNGLHGMTEKMAELDLKAGDHDIKLEMWENTGGAGCQMHWEGDGIAKAIIPETALFHKTLGSRGEILRVTLNEGKQDKTAVSRAMEQDFSKAERVLFEALNQTDKPVKVALGITTGADGQYFESPMIELPPNKWRYDLSVSLTAQNFKSAATKWEHKAAITNPKQITKLSVLVYDAPKTGNVFFDRIRSDKSSIFIRSIPLAAPAPAAPNAIPSGSASWADFDRDGVADVLICSDAGNRLYQNKNGEFVEVTAAVGLSGGSRAAAWADFDGDGELDLVYSNPPALWINDKGKFTNSTKLLPEFPTAAGASVGWIDANGDGNVDLLFGNAENGMALLINKGKRNGFKDESAAFGIGKDSPAKGKANFMSIADFDGDGFTDVLYHQGRGLLLHNEEGKSFKHVTSAKVDYATDTRTGAAFGDFDNDGDLDIFIPQAGKSLLLKNNNDLTFTNVLDQSGDLSKIAGNVQSAVWGDVNRDGNLDLIVAWADLPARLYLGDGKGKFAPPISLGSFDCAPAAAGLALADYDNDGDLDLLVAGARSSAVLVNECRKNAGVSVLKIRVPSASANGALVRLTDMADKSLGVRQVGLVSNLNSQELSEAFFALPVGKYKVSVLSTSGEVQQETVTLEEKGLIWTAKKK